MKSLEERVREEVGENVNPAYLQEVLEKTDTELLEWLLSQCDNNKETLRESLLYVGLEEKRPTLDLGTNILEVGLKCMLFVLKEFQARNRAIT